MVRQQWSESGFRNPLDSSVRVGTTYQREDDQGVDDIAQSGEFDDGDLQLKFLLIALFNIIAIIFKIFDYNEKMRWSTALFLLMWVAGCSVRYEDVALGCDGLPHLMRMEPDMNRSIAHLRDELVALDRSVDPKEAEDLSRIALLYPHLLAKRYRLVAPPNIHNFLINIGMRKRGLCYHWMFDLAKILCARHYKTLDLYDGVAYYDTLREHNALVVTAKGKPFVSGIVLDGWRESGALIFVPLARDRYPWKLRMRACAQAQ